MALATKTLKNDWWISNSDTSDVIQLRSTFPHGGIHFHAAVIFLFHFNQNAQGEAN